MRARLILAGLAIVLVLTIGAKAQSSSGIWSNAAINFPIQASVTPASCTAPAAGVTIYCTTGSVGMLISCNGSPYIPGVVCGGAAAGVTSISVNGGNPQTGSVALTIPSKATSTATVPGASFSQNGALTLTAPSVTTVIQ
jgi:hypothetical protein